MRRTQILVGGGKYESICIARIRSTLGSGRAGAARPGRVGSAAARARSRGVRDRPQAVPRQEPTPEAAARPGARVCRRSHGRRAAGAPAQGRRPGGGLHVYELRPVRGLPERPREPVQQPAGFLRLRPRWWIFRGSAGARGQPSAHPRGGFLRRSRHPGGRRGNELARRAHAGEPATGPDPGGCGTGRPGPACRPVRARLRGRGHRGRFQSSPSWKWPVGTAPSTRSATPREISSRKCATSPAARGRMLWWSSARTPS